MNVIIAILSKLLRLVVSLVLLAVAAGFFIARYFLRLVSTMTRIFAP